ncbi:hypothetical protein MSS4_04077 [Mycobacterium marinum]|nr:hypothetical protein MSS4_04077 [Mycobacterium marinum]
MTFLSALTKPRKSSDAALNGFGESLPTSTADKSPDAGFSTDPQSWTTPKPVEPDPWAPWNLLPLGTLALELNTTVEDLARQLGDDEIILDDIGLRCCTRATAHAAIAKHAAREAAQRDREAKMRANLREQGERATREQRERLRQLENQNRDPVYDPWGR